MIAKVKVVLSIDSTSSFSHDLTIIILLNNSTLQLELPLRAQDRIVRLHLPHSSPLKLGQLEPYFNVSLEL